MVSGHDYKWAADYRSDVLLAIPEVLELVLEIALKLLVDVAF